MTFMAADLPVKAGFEYDIQKNEQQYIFDFKNFPANTNKIEQIGRIRPHKFLLECNGRGGFNIKEIGPPEDRLQKLKELRDKRLITEQQYQIKQQEILAGF
jgi:hypothetical protein